MSQGYKLERTLGDASKVISSLDYSRNGLHLVAASWDGAVYHYDAKTGKLLTTLRDHSKDVRVARFSPDSALLATGGADNKAFVYSLDSSPPTRVFELGGHTGTS